MSNQTDRTPAPAAALRDTRASLAGSLQSHISELDGLRAIAVGMVLVYHFGPNGTVPLLWRVRPLGFIGVDLFFVLSGFLITRILLATRTDALYYRNFYVRRALRIFPAYYCVLALIFCSEMLYQNGVGYRKLVEYGSPVWPWLYLGNFQMALIGRVPPSISLAPLWSLHVEEQFYLLFPLLVRALSRVTLKKVLLGSLVAAPLLRWTLWHRYPDNPFLEYYLLPCRLEGLALGALIAADRTWIPRISRRALGWASIATTAIAFVLLSTLGHRSWSDPFTRVVGYSLFPAAFACIVLWVIRYRGSWQTNWLNAPLLQYLGKRSYAIYLYQFPVSVACAAVLGTQRLWANDLVGFLVVAAATVGAAALSWRFIESPILRLKDRLAPMAGAPADAGLEPLISR